MITKCLAFYNWNQKKQLKCKSQTDTDTWATVDVSWYWSSLTCMTIGTYLLLTHQQPFIINFAGQIFSYFQAWPHNLSRLGYVITSLLVQYLIPLFIVTIAYIMVARAFHVSTEKLSAGSLSIRARRKISRRKRTDILLTVISLVFFVSWAPLNILNVAVNVNNPFKVNL